MKEARERGRRDCVRKLWLGQQLLWAAAAARCQHLPAQDSRTQNGLRLHCHETVFLCTEYGIETVWLQNFEMDCWWQIERCLPLLPLTARLPLATSLTVVPTRGYSSAPPFW